MCADPRRPRGPDAPQIRVLSAVLALLLPWFSDGCDEPPRFESMRMNGNLKPSYAPGDRVEYSCRPGYRPETSGTIVTVCQDDNTWQPLKDVCTRKKCPTLGDPSNGRVDFKIGAGEFGSEAHIICNDGYHVVGSKVLHCELSGDSVVWSDTLPNCLQVQCAAPPQISNGKINSHKDTFEYSEVVTYSCDPSGGSDPYSLVGHASLICTTHGNWSHDPPECKVVKCPYPVVDNGVPTKAIGRTFVYNDTVTFECYRGFSLSGQSTVFCGADSTWVPGLPTCIKEPDTPSIKPPGSTSGTRPSFPPPPATAPPGVPGVPGPSSEPPKGSDGLSGGLITLICLAAFSAVAIGGVFLYKYLQKKKARDIPANAEYSTYQDKSSTPGEPSL